MNTQWVDNLPEDVTEIAKTLAGEHLFQVRDNAKKLTEDKNNHFHTTLAKVIFVSKRSRPYI